MPGNRVYVSNPGLPVSKEPKALEPEENAQSCMPPEGLPCT